MHARAIKTPYPHPYDSLRVIRSFPTHCSYSVAPRTQRAKVRWIQSSTAQAKGNLVVYFARCPVKVPVLDAVFTKWVTDEVGMPRVFPILVVPALGGSATGTFELPGMV